jgi:hypothetical protein
MPIKAVLPGYPIYQGSKKIVIADFKGPIAYTAVAHETITALQFGQGGIDLVEVLNKQLATVNGQLVVVGLSLSGTYFVTVSLPATAPDDASASLVMKWYTTATGVEVVGPANLSAETVRLLFIFV